MEYISEIEANGTTYNLKDEEARNELEDVSKQIKELNEKMDLLDGNEVAY